MSDNIRSIIDYSSYPIAETDNHILQEVIQRARCELKENGIALLPNFMLPWAIRETIQDTQEALPNAFRGISDHNVYLEDCKDDSTLEKDHPKKIISRSSKSCVTHDQIKTSSPLNKLYLSPEMTNFVRLLLQKEALYRTADPLGALNVHFYSEDDQLNWHFDRGEYAVTLLLQAPDGGGHFQYIPSTRSDGNENYDLVKRVLLASQGGQDLTALGVQEADLQPGTLVIFCGHNSMHRVTPVEGNKQRILAVLSYEQKPDVHLNEYTRMKFYGR
ncbi:hypothetical protein OS493_015492 [Desmophyllum pertusum]|uniref:Fe2OG dioxygenase domain-containing protein n=1 Tax=Desmophyllum pertusum TaxID=174260 RepID=A0A9X0CRI7_9CNID|nr:hypothetical protein OS493_015492 [Desmophyllum pertusum]